VNVHTVFTPETGWEVCREINELWGKNGIFRHDGRDLPDLKKAARLRYALRDLRVSIGLFVWFPYFAVATFRIL